MKVYTCTGFEGHYPVGTAAVVVAETPAEAAEFLMRVLRQKHNLPNTIIKASDMDELPVTKLAKVRVLCDGDY